MHAARCSRRPAGARRPRGAWASPSGHALQLGSWWPEQAQSEIFGDGDFRAASVAAPIGFAEPTDDGWSLTGKVSYCSGIPYSTHYMGQALTARRAAGRARPGRCCSSTRPRGVWEMHDDWGHTIGLKGCGSHSITFDGGTIPAHWAIEGAFMVDMASDDGTEGYRLHGNPMYLGRSLGPFTMSLGAAIIGAGFNALDQLETSCARSRRRCRRSCRASTTRTSSATSAPRRRSCRWPRRRMYRAADMHMELCQRAARQGHPVQLRRRPPGRGDRAGGLHLRLGGDGAEHLAHRPARARPATASGCSGCSATWR